MSGETITVAEIKTLIKEEEIQPSDLFGIESLATDPMVKGFLESSIKELKGKHEGELLHRKRDEKGFDKTKEELETQAKEKDEEIKKLKTKDVKRDAVDLFTKKSKERKLDEKQTQFIEQKQSAFEPEDLEKVDKEVDEFMDATLKEYDKTAEIFGVKTEKKKEGEEESSGSPPGNEEEDENDLIPD